MGLSMWEVIILLAVAVFAVAMMGSVFCAGILVGRWSRAKTSLEGQGIAGAMAVLVSRHERGEIDDEQYADALSALSAIEAAR